MAKKQPKKEKEVIDKFKKDTKGMISYQIVEYMRLSDVEKEKFVNKFRNHGIRLPISHENHIVNIDNPNKDKNKSSKSSLTKKEREKGFRSERIWHKGNGPISHECQCSNDVRNSAQWFERTNYFNNGDILREKRSSGDKGFKINKADRYISYQDLDKFKNKVEFVVDDNGTEKDKYKRKFPCQILENKKFIEVGHCVTLVNRNDSLANS